MVALSFGLHLPPAVSGPVLVSGSSVYVGRGCLEQAIEFCRSNGLVIVGMEGVKTDGSAIMPTMEFIADLSEIDGQWQERVVASSDAASLIAVQWSGLTGMMPAVRRVRVDLRVSAKCRSVGFTGL